MSRRNNNQNNQYNNQYYGNNQQYYNGNNNQYYGNGQYNNQNNQYNNQNYYNQNGQYYSQNGQYQNQKQAKFVLYNQQQPNNNNKKKKVNIDKPLLIKIGLFVLAALFIIGIILLVRGCGNSSENSDGSGASYSEENRVVGGKTYGYVTIPGDWLKLDDPNNTSKLQYADKDAVYIVSLDSVPTTDMNAKTYANSIGNALAKKGFDIKAAESTIGKYNAYQIYGQQDSSNIWILLYFFEAEDGYTHYVGVEGPDRTNEAFKIPKTFKLTK